MAINKLIEDVFDEVASDTVKKRRAGMGNPSHRSAFLEGYLSSAFGRADKCPYEYTRRSAAFYHSWHLGVKAAADDGVDNGFVVIKGVRAIGRAKKAASKGRRKVDRPRGKKTGR